jgi:hypothetical protein
MGKPKPLSFLIAVRALPKTWCCRCGMIRWRAASRDERKCAPLMTLDTRRPLRPFIAAAQTGTETHARSRRKVDGATATAPPAPLLGDDGIDARIGAAAGTINSGEPAPPAAAETLDEIQGDPPVL